MNNHSFADDEADENEFYDQYERAAQNAHGTFGDEDDYGSCPLCGGAGEAVAQGRHHWLVCHRDRVKWRIGTGLFGSGLLGWISRGRQKWDRVGDWFKEYREVAPDISSAPTLSLLPGLPRKSSSAPTEAEADGERPDENDEIARLKRMFD